MSIKTTWVGDCKSKEITVSDGFIPEGYRVYPPSVNMYAETVGRVIAAGEGGVPLPVESTKSVCRDSLDRFIATLAELAELERAVDVEFFPGAPRHTPRRRFGEAAE